MGAQSQILLPFGGSRSYISLQADYERTKQYSIPNPSLSEQTQTTQIMQAAIAEHRRFVNPGLMSELIKITCSTTDPLDVPPMTSPGKMMQHFSCLMDLTYIVVPGPSVQSEVACAGARVATASFSGEWQFAIIRP